jgi:hypothetical protein
VINAQCTFIAGPAPASGPDSEIVIVFTDAPGTKAALAAADRLLHRLDLRLTSISPRIVPYPLPLKCPPVPVEFVKREMVELARGLDAEITIHILLCRDRNEAVSRALPRRLRLSVSIGDDFRSALQADPGQRPQLVSKRPTPTAGGEQTVRRT